MAAFCRRAGSCSLLLASLLVVAMAVLALAAVGKGGAGGELDLDPEERVGVGANPFECAMECSTKLTSYIMETISCYVKCVPQQGPSGATECRR